jgi:threonine/homoserine/homoserine lactone efflux protein
MTLPFSDLALYAAALFILFLTPGPVWLALSARTLSGGFGAAWPLAMGVVVGDAVWPFLAILGVSWVVSEFAGVMSVLRLIGTAVFLWMGVSLIRHADVEIGKDSRLTRPGKLAGFIAGVAVILGNPKAILFYMGVLPGFFDLNAITGPDIAAIVSLSIAVPLIGNLIFALSIDRMRRVLTSPRALRRLNVTSGALLIVVGCIIPFT